MIIEESGVMIAEFGSGDILVGGGFLVDSKIPCVSFMQQEPGEIGRYGKKVGLDTDLNVKVRFIFNKIESIDIVIEQLEMAKKQFGESAWIKHPT